MTLLDIAQSLRDRSVGLTGADKVIFLVAAQAVEAVAQYQWATRQVRYRLIDAEKELLAVGGTSGP